MGLGCEPHTVFAADRGGVTIFGQITEPTLVRWDRVRDDISGATIRVSNPGPKCGKLLESLRSGRHELVIYRGSERAWEGPITRIGYARTYVEIEARDVMHYVYRTIMRAKYNNAYPNITKVTTRMENILIAELARKEALTPPINVLPYLDIRTNTDTAGTSRNTLAYQMTAWEDIDTMAARSGLDYAVIGRRIYGYDVHDVIGRTRPMTEADFLDDVIVTEYGMELATYSAVTDGEGRWGSFGGTDDYYGEWELLNTSYEEGVDAEDVTPPTTAELRSQAQRNLAGRYPAPVIVRVPDQSQIDPTTTALTFEDFVPGIRVPVRATLTARTVTQEQKLDRVRFEQTPDGETISVTLSPAPGVLPEAWDEDGSDAE